MNDYELLKETLNQVDVDDLGLAVIWGVSEGDVRGWFDGSLVAPKWVGNYLRLLLDLQRIGRICYDSLGDPYE